MNIKKIIGAGFILLGTCLAISIIKKLSNSAKQNGNHDSPKPWRPWYYASREGVYDYFLI